MTTPRKDFEAWYAKISPHVAQRSRTEFDYVIWKAAIDSARSSSDRTFQNYAEVQGNYHRVRDERCEALDKLHNVSAELAEIKAQQDRLLTAAGKLISSLLPNVDNDFRRLPTYHQNLISELWCYKTGEPPLCGSESESAMEVKP